MKKLIVLGFIIITSNALALCPLKSYSLNNLATKARSLEKNFQKLTTCYKDSNVQAPVKDIMSAIRKLSYTFSGQKQPPATNPGDGFGDGTGDDTGDDGWGEIGTVENFTPVYEDELQKLDLGGLQTDVQRAMEAFFQLSQLSKDQRQNAECSSAANNNNVWIGLIEVFNGFAPMAMATLSKGAPQLSPYLLGAQAVGSVVQQVLKSLQERAERYSMVSAEKRSAFIDASCLYHDLALNTFVLDETLNTEGNYYESILESTKLKRDTLLSQVKNESQILKILSQEFIDISEDLSDFVDFEYAGNKSEVTDPIDDIINDDNGDDCDDAWGCDDDWDGGWGDDSNLGDNYRKTYVCSALQKYFDERNFGVARSQRYKVYLSYLRKFIKDSGLKKSLVSFDINYDIFTDALNELRYGNSTECEVSHFERPLKFFANYVEVAKEKLNYDEELVSMPMSDMQSFYISLKDVSELSYDVYLLEEKVAFLERIQSENIEVDLGEIYLLESSINSQLVKGKKYSYSWLEFNSNRGVEFLHSFKKKFDLYESKINSSSDKQKNCQLISKLGRDFRVAQNMRERNILYCQIMFPFVNSVDHAEFASLCQKHGIEEYKFEGPTAAPEKKRRRYFIPIMIGPLVPTPIYWGKKPERSVAFRNLYSNYSETYKEVEEMNSKNQCGNQFDGTKLDLD